MIDFAWPWAALLLPLPALLSRVLPVAMAAEEAALWVPELDRYSGLDAAQDRRAGARWRRGAGICCWLLLVLATTRPQWLGEPLALPVTGRDLQMAVDLSGSMQTPDFTLGQQRVTRLDALKAVAKPFIDRRSGDRIGLILFGDQAYVQVPLTFDHAMVQQLLDEALIGLAGERTAIGDAIGLALKRAGADSEQRVLILLTDGANTAGELPPARAAELAARAGLRIHTIGMGAERMEVGGLLFNRTVNPSADLDEATLQAIAAATGGTYFRARNSAELEEIYALLDQLEPRQQDAELLRPVTELYPWPLAAALAGVVLMALFEVRATFGRGA